MRRRTKSLLAAGTLGAVVLAGAGIAAANSHGAEDANEGPDVPITGADLDRASQVAVDHVGGGRVTGTEVGDEERYYEVEVTRADGTQVDVQLDEQFTVVSTEDEAGEGDTGENETGEAKD